ncbi:MAG: hypothetical protein QQN63_08895 [Nitrosopumilus sp.]
MQQTGMVAVVTKNKYGYGLKLEGNDQWFNSKFEPGCNKGDSVTFDDKDKRYIDNLKVSASAPEVSGGVGSSAGGYDKRQTSIVRQNAITNANAYFALVGHKKATVEELIAIAQQIEVYTLGNPLAEDNPLISAEDQEQADALKALADGNA